MAAVREQNLKISKKAAVREENLKISKKAAVREENLEIPCAQNINCITTSVIIYRPRH
jgi:hypothetical protein